ncbi:MAG: lysylphosphatidylglycerol synthase transmembrane domain-containing protein, partial [Acidobacteriota bacterium]
MKAGSRTARSIFFSIAVTRESTITRKKFLHVTAGFLMTILCLAAALWGLDLEELSQSFSGLNFATLPLNLALLFLFFWLKAIRWRFLLTPLRIFRTQEIVPPLMIGFMGNNILPAHLGELIRVFVLGRQFTLSKAAVFSTVVLERVLDMLVILIFVGIGLRFVEGLPSWVQTTALSMAGFALFISLLLLAFVFRTRLFLEAYRKFFHFLPSRSFHKIDEFMASMAHGLGSIKNIRNAFWIILTSFLQWTVMGGMIYVSLASLGLWLSPMAAFITTGVS